MAEPTPQWPGIPFARAPAPMLSLSFHEPAGILKQLPFSDVGVFVFYFGRVVAGVGGGCKMYLKCLFTIISNSINWKKI